MGRYLGLAILHQDGVTVKGVAVVRDHRRHNQRGWGGTFSGNADDSKVPRLGIAEAELELPESRTMVTLRDATRARIKFDGIGPPPADLR